MAKLPAQPGPKDGVRMSPRKPITFEIVEDFRDRTGWCVVASFTDAWGNPVEYECTKQFPQPHDAVAAFTGWMRRMTVEDQME